MEIEKHQKCPPSVIEFYKSYENTKSKLKTITLRGSSVFHIDERYQIIDAIGQGAYGVVVAAKDQLQGNQMVAIKKIEKAFEHKLYAKRTVRQLKLLRLLKHENIIALETILLPQSREDFDDIYVVFEIMETDVGAIIKAKKSLSIEHIKFFIYQILRALKYLHGAQVLHRDLKPRNLLINSDCDLKLCDFGLARSIDPNQKTSVMTDYVTTRWYRAPQLLLSFNHYDERVDVWSTGIIFAELLLQKYYMPGNSTREQLEMIFNTLGTPSEIAISHIPQPKYRQFVQKHPKQQGIPFETQFQGVDQQAIDLLKKMLVFDYPERISIDDALKHPFLENFHAEEDEPEGKLLDPLEFEFENEDLTRAQLQDIIYEEILLYHYPEFVKQYDQKLKEKKSVQKHIFNNDNQYVTDPQSDEEDSD